jgi:hypothetical protein
LRELEDANWVSKWDWNTATLTRLLTADGAASNNGTKQNAALTGDILGDWREEVVFRSADNLSLRIYSTTIPASNRLYTLMHDTQYRLGVAWQNVGYNQPPHPSFFLGDGMSAPPSPEVWHLDTESPEFKSLAPSQSTLVPADGRLVTVTIDYDVVDLLDPYAKARIVDVTSSEVDPDKKRRYEQPDVVLVNRNTVQLRAERDPGGPGRVYTIEVEGSDRSHNHVTRFIEVRVPAE